MLLKPIQQYAPVVDTLHLNLVRNLAPDRTFELVTHQPIDLLKITRYNALESYYSDGYTLSLIPTHKDRHYHLCYLVKIGGNVLGTVFLDRKNGFEYKSDLIPFHLNNAALYTNWIPMLAGFLAAFELKISTYAQLHIAIDTNESVIKQFYKLQDSPHFLMNHARELREDVKVRGTRSKGNKRQDSIYLGSAKSAKHTCIYNKTIDILEKEKDYISDWQKENGLDISRKIERIELRLSNDVLKTYRSLYVSAYGEYLTPYQKKRQGLENASETFNATTAIRVTEIDYTMLQDAGYLMSIFEIYNNIDFRHADNNNISRCTRYNFIDFGIYKNKNTVMRTTTFKTSQNNNYRKERQSLESQIALFKSTLNPLFFEAAAAYATEHRLRSELTRLINLYNIADFVAANFPAEYFTDMAIEEGVYLP